MTTASSLPLRRASLAFAILVAGCGGWTDPATRIAAELEGASRRLGDEQGARYTLVHAEPSKRGECEGPYRVQLDKVGALIVWCYDGAGRTTASGSTTYHNNFVDTVQTFIINKPERAPLRIELERRGTRAVITGAY